MIKRILAFLISFCLIFEQAGFAQLAIPLGIPGYLSSLAPVADKFRPIHLRSINLNPGNGNFELILDKGDLKDINPRQMEEITQELYRYFRVGLALPNKYFWVNLRPDSSDGVIELLLEKTDVGRIMLASDLQLKKDLANFTSPQTPEGKLYWNKLYAKASELYNQQDIEIPTLTRPWIVPGEVIIRASEKGAFVYKATLKVMLEQDYIKDSPNYNFNDPRQKELNSYSSELIRELIIPKLTREVNSSRRYSQLRQVYYSLILAQWFKNKSQVKNIDNQDLTGLTSKTNWSKDTYYQSYRKSFQQGEYNRREQVSSVSGLSLRQYFSGGIVMMDKPVAEWTVIPEGVKEFFAANQQYFARLTINSQTGDVAKLLPESSVLAYNGAQQPAVQNDGGKIVFADAENIRKNLAAALALINSVPKAKKYTGEELLAEVRRPGSRMLFNFADGRLVALIWYYDNTDQTIIWDRMATAPSYRRQGRATALLLHLAEHIPPGTAIKIPINEANETFNLYERWGFERDPSGQFRVVRAGKLIENSQSLRESIDPSLDEGPYIQNAVSGQTSVQRDGGTASSDRLDIPENSWKISGGNDARYLETADIYDCVAAVLYDRKTKAAALAHFSLESDVRAMVGEITAALKNKGGEDISGLEVSLIGDSVRDKEGWQLLWNIQAGLEAAGINLTRAQAKEKLEEVAFPAKYLKVSFDRGTGKYNVLKTSQKSSFAQPQKDGGDYSGNNIAYIPEEITRYDRSKGRDILEKFFSFEDFMNEALFNPDWGYYSSGKVQIKQDLLDEGHFRTYPEIMSPYFSQLIGERIFDIWKQMKEGGLINPGEKFQIVEFGAGNGTLAYDMVSFLTRQPKIYPENEAWLEFVSQLQYVIGEKSEFLRENKQRPRLAVFGNKVEIRNADARNPEEFIKSGFKGVIVSNELPDAFGVQRVRLDRRFIKNGFFEVCVSVPTLSLNTLLLLGLPTEEIEELYRASGEYSRSFGLPAETEAVYLSAKSFTELVKSLEHSQDKRLREQFEIGLRFKEIFVDGALVPKVQDYINRNKEIISHRLKNNHRPFIIPVNTASADYIRSVAKILNAKGSSGYVLTIDYGGNSHRVIGGELPEILNIRCYSAGVRRSIDYYVYAGYKDITSNVDATYLHEVGKENNLETVVFGKQGILLDYNKDKLTFQLMQQRNPLKTDGFLGQPGFFLLLQASGNILAQQRYKYPYYTKEWGREQGAALEPDEMLFVRNVPETFTSSAFLEKLKQVGVSDPDAFVKGPLKVLVKYGYELTNMISAHFWDDPGLAGRIIDVLDESGLLEKGLNERSAARDGGREFSFSGAELNAYIQSEMSAPAIESLKKTYENLYGLAVSVNRNARVPIASIVPSSQDKITLKELAARIFQLSNGTGSNIILWKDTDKSGVLRNFILDGHHRFAGMDVLSRKEGSRSAFNLITADMFIPSEEGMASFSRQNLRPISEINVVLPDASIVKLKEVSLKEINPAQGVILEVKGNSQADGGEKEEIKNINEKIYFWEGERYQSMNPADREIAITKDAEAMWVLYNLIWKNDLKNNENIRAEKIVEFKKLLAGGSSELLWVFEPVPGQIKGYLTAAEKDGYGSFNNIAVAEEYQRNKVGTTLCLAMMEFMQSKGVKRFETNTVGEGLKNIVESLGWQHDEEGGPYQYYYEPLLTEGGSLPQIRPSIISGLINQALVANTHTIYPVLTGKLAMYLMGDHGMATAAWELARLEGKIENKATLVHFDAHSDDASGAEPYNAPTSPEGIRKLYFNINQFIAPAVCSGLIQKIYWVKPDYVLAEGDYEYWAQVVIMEDGTEKAFFGTRKPKPGDSIFGSKIKSVKLEPVSVTVHEIRYPGYPNYPDKNILPDLSSKGPVILDIDADFFANKHAKIKGAADKAQAETAVKNVISAIKNKINPGVVTLALSSGYTTETYMPEIAAEIISGIIGTDQPAAGEPVKLINKYQELREELLGRDNSQDAQRDGGEGSVMQGPEIEKTGIIRLKNVSNGKDFELRRTDPEQNSFSVWIDNVELDSSFEFDEDADTISIHNMAIPAVNTSQGIGLTVLEYLAERTKMRGKDLILYNVFSYAVARMCYEHISKDARYRINIENRQSFEEIDWFGKLGPIKIRIADQSFLKYEKASGSEEFVYLLSENDDLQARAMEDNLSKTISVRLEDGKVLAAWNSSAGKEPLAYQVFLSKEIFDISIKSADIIPTEVKGDSREKGIKDDNTAGAVLKRYFETIQDLSLDFKPNLETFDDKTWLSFGLLYTATNDTWEKAIDPVKKLEPGGVLIGTGIGGQNFSWLCHNDFSKAVIIDANHYVALAAMPLEFALISMAKSRAEYFALLTGVEFTQEELVSLIDEPLENTLVAPTEIIRRVGQKISEGTDDSRLQRIDATWKDIKDYFPAQNNIDKLSKYFWDMYARRDRKNLASGILEDLSHISKAMDRGDGWLSSEANFNKIKTMLAEGKIIGVYADFSSREAMGKIRQYMLDNKLQASAVYVSNIRDIDWLGSVDLEGLQRMDKNLSLLPATKDCILIESAEKQGKLQLENGWTGYEISLRNFEDFLKSPQLETKLSQDNSVLKKDRQQSDGGDAGGIDLRQNELGGIDFRELPVAGQPAMTSTLMPQLQQLAANSKMKDLNQEWSQIRGEMLAPEMPYSRIKEYIAVCLNRPGCRNKLDQVVSRIIDILRMEEEQALATNQELQDILMYLS